MKGTKWLWHVLACAAIAVTLAACGSSAQVRGLTTGTGYNSAQHTVNKQTTSFNVGQTAYVVFTVNTSAAHATAEVKILNSSGALEDASLPIAIKTGTHSYEQKISMMGAGMITIEVSYNGQVQASVPVTVG